MDDTVWLASSKNELIDIITIVNKFFLLTGIKVNATKSNLLIINHQQVQPIDRNITFDNQVISFDPKQKPICYLGIYLEANVN